MVGCNIVSIWNLQFEKEIKSFEKLLKPDDSKIWNAHQKNQENGNSEEGKSLDPIA